MHHRKSCYKQECLERLFLLCRDGGSEEDIQAAILDKSCTKYNIRTSEAANCGKSCLECNISQLMIRSTGNIPAKCATFGVLKLQSDMNPAKCATLGDNSS